MHSETWIMVAIIAMVAAMILLVVGCGCLYDAVENMPMYSPPLPDEKPSVIPPLIQEAKNMIWECLYAGLALSGGILSSFLALRSRRATKITKAIIKGVEKAQPKDVKSSIHQCAIDAGVADRLHKLVQKVTSLG